LSAPAFLDEKMQKNAKVVSFGIFICKNAIKNAKTVISGVFILKMQKNAVPAFLYVKMEKNLIGRNRFHAITRHLVIIEK
jgi:hypothetical protein